MVRKTFILFIEKNLYFFIKITSIRLQSGASRMVMIVMVNKLVFQINYYCVERVSVIPNQAPYPCSLVSNEIIHPLGYFMALEV